MLAGVISADKEFNTAECDFLGSFLLLKLAETIEDETLADRFVKQVSLMR